MTTKRESATKSDHKPSLTAREETTKRRVVICPCCNREFFSTKVISQCSFCKERFED